MTAPSRTLRMIASDIASEADTIATSASTVRAFQLARQIANLARELASLDLDAPACGCWVCEGRAGEPGVACDAQHRRACEIAVVEGAQREGERLHHAIGRILVDLATRQRAAALRAVSR